MFVRCFLITLCVLVLLQLATGSRSPKQQEPQHELPLSPSQSQSLSKCAAKQGECDESEGPVCGTDDQTYPTRCHLQRVQCSGHQVSLKHRGNCKGCLGALQYAHRESARNPKIFIPRCRNDGNYAAMQCLGDTGCWCSDSSGNPIKNTSTRRGRPKCAVYRRNNRRRSPTRLFSLDAEAANSSDGGGNGGHRPCSKADRRAFNNHLIEVFRSEQVRSGQPQAAGANDDSVLDWKFAQLDANANQVLERQEVRELKKLVKRAVKPKRCGRAFGKYCDVNKDDNLSRVEWSNCLAKDASQLLNAKPEEATNNESEGDANCWTDREVAREEQRHGGNRSFYVPECMSDGRYKRVQCYSSFCWCVHEETGKNIPGTFGQKRPQCDEVSAANRPMKGCTEPRKTQFLKELKEFLNTNILPSSNTGRNSTMWKSEDERIATLSFVFLDKNKNKSWERKEWKVFRDLVTNASNLSKCGKKMPRYCDVNGDKKISLSEWVNCLQSHRMETTTTAKPAQSNETATSRLLGSNPLEQYLKDY
ncbi:SPARC-related modular calcium-binding protein 2 isoform X3 [Drosophila grimshawi]|uniref:SPARC-related modular calcium-binding protein 2 isoform X3 n=1 Tax=Drosophila grimshawi TaxID=7222 RepID=UPI000C870899|nr:SPARC-related modular calcium-binding protein 2 isoform X3 [Drosophila grimshawi]